MSDHEDENDFQEFIEHVTKLEPIHKIYHENCKKFIISLRVIIPQKDPFTETTHFETNTTLQSNSQTPLSFLTEINDSSKAPRLLIIYTDAKSVLYECEMTYRELSDHRSEVSMDEMTWESFLSHLSDGIRSEENIQTKFTDDSKDILRMTITCPVNKSIKLVYRFDLCAIRDESDVQEKIGHLLFDSVVYCDTLYTKSTRDASTIQELREEIENLKDALKKAEQKLPNHIGLDFSPQKPKPKLKRKLKAPKSLLNPSSKRFKAKGAKIT